MEMMSDIFATAERIKSMVDKLVSWAEKINHSVGFSFHVSL